MNIILYVMDALRPDFLGCYGFEKNTSPNIDTLAEDGVLYKNAYSTATWTKAAAASILTSRYPRSLRMMHQKDVMKDYRYSLQNILGKKGFDTYAASANEFVSPYFGFSGFEKFFLVSEDKELMEKGRKVKDRPSADLNNLPVDRVMRAHSEDINEKVLPLLEENIKNQFFLCWPEDTHSPYYVLGDKSYFGNSTDDFIRGHEVNADNLEKVKSLYFDMIRYNDKQFGKVIKRLKKEGKYEDSLIIVTADHGDSFGDHSLPFIRKPITGHNGVPYEEVIRIPLIVKYPENRFGGKEISDPVQLIDIHPTVLKVCGMENENIPGEGVSLSPDSGELGKYRTIFVESQPNPESFYSAAVRKGNNKLIKTKNELKLRNNPKKIAIRIFRKLFTPELELYDLSNDPSEKQNLSKKKKKNIVKELLEEYKSLKRECNKKASEIEVKRKEKIDEEVKERLKALGYF